jgi:hypothetical protein
MVRVESFTTLTKLGSGTEESFTSLLISRVCSLKTLKTFKLPELKDTSENDHQHNERIEAPISLLYPLSPFSIQVTFNSSLIFLHKITLLI